MAEIGKWDEVANGPMSLESVRSQYQPEERYRVSWRTYPAGASFNGWAQVGRHYIINGGCTIHVRGHSWNLAAGDFADLPEGDYQFSVTGELAVELVSVWELPESFWRSTKDTKASE